MSKTKAELEQTIEELESQNSELTVALETAQQQTADLAEALEITRAEATANDEEIPEHGSNEKLSKKERQVNLQGE